MLEINLSMEVRLEITLFCTNTQVMTCIILTEDEVKNFGALECFFMQTNLRQNMLEHLNMLFRNGVY